MKIILLMLPILVTLFLSIRFFFIKKKKSISIKILGIFFLFFCYALIAVLFQYLQEFYPFIQSYFYLIEISFYSVMLSLPVIIYFYVSSLTDSINKYKGINDIAPHFFIPLQALIFNIYPYLYNNTLRKGLDYTNYFSLKVVFIALNIYYLTLIILLYKKHREQIKNILSYEIGVSLNWILFFLLGYLSFIACFFVLNPDSSPFVVYIPFLLLMIYIYFQRNTQITVKLESDNLLNTKIDLESKDLENSQAKSISDEKREILKNQLIDYLEKEKVYLQKDLTIYDVAKALNTNSNYISNILNNMLNCNFVTFINSYRIEDAKTKLISADYSNYTIEAISAIVGFNSKSAFNNAFKNLVGITPSDYIKLNKIF
jgi:AraC-like DNA-binding protein